jgi:hypothetical protein
MPINVIMVKRPARSGEVGLFPDSAAGSEDLDRVKTGRSYMVSVSSPRTLEQNRYIWALATFVHENHHSLADKDEAMEYLKIKCRHYRLSYNPDTCRTNMVPKSLTEFDKQEFSQFINRAIHVICHEIFPGMNEEELRAEMNEQTKEATHAHKSRVSHA